MNKFRIDEERDFNDGLDALTDFNTYDAHMNFTEPKMYMGLLLGIFDEVEAALEMKPWDIEPHGVIRFFSGKINVYANRSGTDIGLGLNVITGRGAVAQYLSDLEDWERHSKSDNITDNRGKQRHHLVFTVNIFYNDKMAAGNGNYYIQVDRKMTKKAKNIFESMKVAYEECTENDDCWTRAFEEDNTTYDTALYFSGEEATVATRGRIMIGLIQKLSKMLSRIANTKPFLNVSFDEIGTREKLQEVHTWLHIVNRRTGPFINGPSEEKDCPINLFYAELTAITLTVWGHFDRNVALEDIDNEPFTPEDFGLSKHILAKMHRLYGSVNDETKKGQLSEIPTEMKNRLPTTPAYELPAEEQIDQTTTTSKWAKVMTGFNATRNGELNFKKKWLECTASSTRDFQPTYRQAKLANHANFFWRPRTESTKNRRQLLDLDWTTCKRKMAQAMAYDNRKKADFSEEDLAAGQDSDTPSAWDVDDGWRAGSSGQRK